MNIDMKEDLLGKILFVLSIILLGFLFAVAVKLPFLSIDEWFTLGMTNLSLSEMIHITIIDVHPPLYYAILKFIIMLLNAVNINLDLILTMKLVSIIPYVLILAISITKIRKYYGWLSCGLFAFTLISMSNFFMQYLTARMYSWGLLFVVCGFLCLKPILEENNVKSWILLSIFAVFGAYTHYFIAIYFICLYFILFVYILIKNREFLKNWLISTVFGIILYVPWIFKLFIQLNKVHNDYWVKPVTPDAILNSFSLLLTSYHNLIVAVIVSILFIAFLSLIIKDWLANRDIEDEFLLIGLLSYPLTVFVVVFISFVFKPILLVRYFIPFVSVVWIVVSIYINKIQLKKVIVPLVLVLLVIGIANLGVQLDDINGEHQTTDETLNFLNEINDNNTIVVYEGLQKYMRFSGFLGNASNYTCYTIGNETQFPQYVYILNLNKDEFLFNSSLDNYSDSDIYFIHDKSRKLHSTSDYDVEKAYRLNNCIFTKINVK